MKSRLKALVTVFFVIGLFMVMFFCIHVYGVGWTTTEVVSTESTDSSYSPSLCVGSDGTVHIAWYDTTDYGGSGGDRDIFYKKFEPGSGWTTTEVVSTESTDYSMDPSLGVGSDGTVHIAWWDWTDYSGSGGGMVDPDIFYKRFEPGTGWTTTEVVSTESTNVSVYPSLGVGSDGTVHIAWQDDTDYGGASTDYDIFYKRFVPGSGWTSTEVVSAESTNGSNYPSLGVGSDGAVHIAWADDTDYGGSGTDRDIFYRSFVPGTGWTTTEVVSTETTWVSMLPSLGVGSDGTVHIAWRDSTLDYGGSGTDVDIFYKSFVPGNGWMSTEVVSTESTDHSGFPSLGVGSDGAVHIAWEDITDFDGSGTDKDIFYRRRHIFVAFWESTEVVSTESTDDSEHPSLGVGSDGAVHIAWEEETSYGGSGSDSDIFYKRFDASPPLEVSIDSLDPTSGYVGTTVNLMGTIETPGGNYWIGFDINDDGGISWGSETMKTGTAPTGSNVVSDSFTVPSCYGDSDGYPHKVALVDELTYGTDDTFFYVLSDTLNPPEASFTYSPLNPEVNEVVTFDASGSSDSDGTIVSYFWDFGDGVNGSGSYATATHSYTDEGTYTVTLTVTDDDGLTDTTTQTITDVIPEFSTSIILLSIIILALAIIFYRKKLT